MTAPERTWETSRLLAKPAAVADVETKEFLSRCERVWVEGSACPWSLWSKQDGAFVGLIEVRVRASAMDLGYALARRWWRQGLMSEAVTATVDWALAQPTIFRAWATCDVDNVASARLLERVGMEREGCFVGGWCIRT